MAQIPGRRQFWVSLVAIVLAPSLWRKYLAVDAFGSRSSLSHLLLAVGLNSGAPTVLGLARRYPACSKFWVADGFGSRSSLSCLLLAVGPKSGARAPTVVGLARRYCACSWPSARILGRRRFWVSLVAIVLAPGLWRKFLVTDGFGSCSLLSCLLLAFGPNSCPPTVLGLARRYRACS